MSSMSSGYRIIYANESSDSYGVSLASSFGSTSRSTNIENRNVMMTVNPFYNTYAINNIKYDNPLSFDIILYNIDGTWIDAKKERLLKKWLFKNNFNWFQIEQEDLSFTYYYAIATTFEILDVGSYSGGAKITFLCDSPWAYSELKTKKYTSVTTLSFDFYAEFDFDEYILCPDLVITSLSDNSTVSITNLTTGDTVEFTWCSLNEIITLGKNDAIKTSLGTVMIDRWNKKSLGIVEGKNSFTLTGNFNLSMSYRLPIRVGA